MNILKSIFNHIFLSMGNALPSCPFFNKHRSKFYRIAGVRIASDVVIAGALSLRSDTTNKVIIGHNTYLNSEVRFGCQNDCITIGNHCLIGPRVSFESGGHNVVYESFKGRGFYTKKIIVADKVWIGAGSIILQGVTIGKGSVIAAGSVVVKYVNEFCVVGGVPAKFIKLL